jgi:hypothetical protein
MFFESIYRWFISWFGSDLAQHLKGWDETAGNYIKPNFFLDFGIITLVVVALSCILYYYIIDHPRQNRRCKWLCWLLSVAGLNLLIAFVISFKDVIAGNISPDIATTISLLHCLGFGLTNFVISALFFLIISFVIKLLSKSNILPSRNCEHSPFKF